MSIEFNTPERLYTCFHYRASTDTYTLIGYNQINFDYFLENAEVGDSVIFASRQKWQGLELNIVTPLVASSIEGVWEYNTYDPIDQSWAGSKWLPLENVRDETNSFQNAGLNEVHWKVPFLWNNFSNPSLTAGGGANGAMYYEFHVQFKITSLIGMTEGGRNGTTANTFQYDIKADNNSNTTLDDLNIADKGGTVLLESRTGVTAIDNTSVFFKDIVRPNEKGVAGGIQNDLYITVANLTGITSLTIQLIGMDITGASQTEDVIITANGITNSTLYWKTCEQSRVIAVIGTGSFDFTIITNGWGVLTKVGNSQFSFMCNLKTLGNTHLISKQEQIMFQNNFRPLIRSNITIGEVFRGDKTMFGSSIIMEATDSDYSWGFIAQNNAKIYNSEIRFKNLNGLANTHINGFWGGGMGQDLNQDIIAVYGENWRQFSFSNTKNAIHNVSGYGMHMEGIGAINNNITLFGGSYSFRPASIDSGEYIHNCDMSACLVSPINPWMVSRHNTHNWLMHYVDCKWGTFLKSRRVYWRNDTSTGTIQDMSLNEEYSMLLKIIDKKGSPVPNAQVIITDKNNNIIVNSTTQDDGYAGVVSGNITSATANSITDNSKNWTVDEWWFREIFITSGTGVGQRRFVKKGNTANTLTITSAFDVTPDNTSKYVIIPNVAVRKYTPLAFTPGTLQFSAVEELGEFTIKIKVNGYLSYEKTLAINEKVDWNIKLFNSPFKKIMGI